MCMQDWRVGRLIRSVITRFDVGDSVGLSYPRNNQRVGISFFAGGALVGATTSIQLNANGLLVAQLQNTQMFYHFTIATHGDLPTQAWTIGPAAVVDSGTVIEYFMPEQYLTAALREFNSQYNPNG